MRYSRLEKALRKAAIHIMDNDISAGMKPGERLDFVVGFIGVYSAHAAISLEAIRTGVLPATTAASDKPAKSGPNMKLKPGRKAARSSYCQCPKPCLTHGT